MTTLLDALTAYRINAWAEGKSLRTIEWITSSARYFSEFLGQDQDISTITANDLRQFIRDRAATRSNRVEPHMREASMAKYFCCEAANRAADHVMQIHGAIHYMDECPVSRYYRDMRAATIADGTTEIQKWIIARELGC